MSFIFTFLAQEKDGNTIMQATRICSSIYSQSLVANVIYLYSPRARERWEYDYAGNQNLLFHPLLGSDATNNIIPRCHSSASKAFLCCHAQDSWVPLNLIQIRTACFTLSTTKTLFCIVRTFWGLESTTLFAKLIKFHKQLAIGVPCIFLSLTIPIFARVSV